MSSFTQVQFFYDKTAYEFAFLGNNSEIVVDKDGNVYKDFISPQSLVITNNGDKGAAGQAVRDFIEIKVNSKFVDKEINAVVAGFADVAGNVQFVKGGTRGALDEWKHGLVVIDNDLLQLRLYVEGALVQSVSIPNAITLFTAVKDTLIGKSTKGALSNFNLNGSVDDFRIYEDLLDREAYIEKTSVAATQDSALIQLQGTGDTTNNLSVGQYVWYVPSSFEEIWNDYPTITEINSSTTFTVSSDAISSKTGTMRFYDNPPYTAEALAVEDIYNYGKRVRHFNKKTFISPKGKNKGNVASFKIKAEFPIQVRGIAIEYNDGVIRR
jgi:hypothetical protein